MTVKIRVFCFYKTLKYFLKIKQSFCKSLLARAFITFGQKFYMRNLVLCITMAICPTFLFAQKASTSQEEKLQLLENVTHLINTYYVYPDKAKEITSCLKDVYTTAKYDSLNSPTQLENEITKDIFSISKDKHIRIEYNPRLENDILKFNASGKNADKISHVDLEKERQKNFYFRKVQILPSNIGYIEFTNFAKPGKKPIKRLQL